MSATVGSLVPGVCLDAGAESFGLTIGIAQRQRIVTFPANAGNELAPPHGRGITWRREDGRLWVIGAASLRHVPRRVHTALISGRTVCGVVAETGTDSLLHAGFDSRQRVLLREGVAVDLQGTNRTAWTDLFDFQVTAGTNLTTETTNAP